MSVPQCREVPDEPPGPAAAPDAAGPAPPPADSSVPMHDFEHTLDIHRYAHAPLSLHTACGKSQLLPPDQSNDN